MVHMNELMARAETDSYEPRGIEPTVVVGTVEPADDVVQALAGYFGEDDGRTAVRLVVAGSVAGYLERSDLYSFAGSLERGWGVSDAFFTMGESRIHFRTARCRVDGSEFMISRFDPDDPPTCPDHDEALELLT